MYMNPGVSEPRFHRPSEQMHGVGRCGEDGGEHFLHRLCPKDSLPMHQA